VHSDDKWLNALQNQRSASTLNWQTALLLSIFLGWLGADRFYSGRIGLGLLKLVTFGGYFVWWVVDIALLLQGRMKDDLGREIRRQVRA
jgi:TM2 domain-containing membrane protein YozV